MATRHSTVSAVALSAVPRSTQPSRRAKKRGNGAGSIFKRADGTWCGMVSAGKNADGRRIRYTLYGETMREVQEKLTRTQSTKLSGMLCEPSKQTVAEYLRQWLADAVKPNLKHGTYATYASTVKRYIIPHVGGVKLSKLTPDHVQGLHRVLSASAKSDSTSVRTSAHAVLRRALSQAVRSGTISRNVCDAIDKPTAKRTADIHPLDADQASALLVAAQGDRLEALYVLALTTAMRGGELLGLRWDCVDLKAKTVRVEKTLVETDGMFALDEPKTKASRRRISLESLAVDALQSHRKRMVAEGHAACEFVFCTTVGTPWRRTNLRRSSFKPLLVRAGLPDIRFHDLRHTSATLMLAAGVHPKVVQQRLGHTNISITLDLYSHVMPGMDEAAAEAIGAMLRAGKTRFGVTSAG
jgi:integrase